MMTNEQTFEPFKTRAAAHRFYGQHFTGIGLNSLVSLETSVAKPRTKPEKIGENLAFFLRAMDAPANEYRWDNAPAEVTLRAIAMRDLAVQRITEAGLDTAAFGMGVAPKVY